jgi:predicted Zn-dependent protease with MMP-like domain
VKSWWQALELLTVPAIATMVVCGCQCRAPESAGADELRPPKTAPTRRPFEKLAAPTVRAPCESQGSLPLEAAQTLFEDGQLDGALGCADKAAALQPREVLAHLTRGQILASLGDLEEASLAFSRALALDPESLEALAAASEFYLIRQTPSRAHDELGLLYAERGFELATGLHEEELALQFASLAALGSNNLGHAPEALEQASYVLQKKANDVDAQYEKALALFELCRFDEATKAFERLTKIPEKAAFAQHHLGLLRERKNQTKAALAAFAEAQRLDAEAFPLAYATSRKEFESQVALAVASLPVEMQSDLKEVKLEIEDWPAEEDLVANEVPLSPTILGLFRGPALGEDCDEKPDVHGCRSIVLYLKNLARTVRNQTEMSEQIKATLMHEIGHLHGEDDAELAARGLE